MAGQFRPRLRERETTGLVVQRRGNRYAVPAGWVIACVVLVAAAQGAPTLGSLPHERPRAGTRPGRRTRLGRCGNSAREGGSVGRSEAALAREAAASRHRLLAGHRAQRLVLLA